MNVRNFVADKLKWQLQLIIDVDLTANARLVGCLIAHDLNVVRGVAWRSQDNMALALGVHKTTVRRFVAELAKAGYLAVQKARRRGQSLNYQALIRDDANVHQSIDRAVAARRKTTSETASKDAPALLGDAALVASVLLCDAAMVAPPLLNEASNVAPVLQQVTPGATLTLEEPYIPPSPPIRREKERGIQANTVRDRTFKAADSSKANLPFQDRDVREAARQRLGDEGVRSWLVPNAWDVPARAIVCQLNFTADRLTRDLRSDLKALGVTVVCDKRRFAELSRPGRTVDRLMEGAT